MHSKSVLVLALAGSSLLLAHDEPQTIADPESEFLPSIAPPAASTWIPLTARQNFQYGFDRVFNPVKLLLFGVEAAMDQERGAPEKWGQGMRWYGARYGDRFGRALIRENMAFGVRALTGEDPRYELCQETGIWKRSKHAVTRTFVVRGRNGHLMPAYSRFVSDYATPLISQQWMPEPFHASHVLSTGTAGIGIAVASNRGTEFWPDIRRRFLRH
jgi:hypothetical protein